MYNLSNQLKKERKRPLIVKTKLEDLSYAKLHIGLMPNRETKEKVFMLFYFFTFLLSKLN